MNVNRTLDLIENIYKMDNPIFNHEYILNILNQFYSNDEILKIKYYYLYFADRVAMIYRNIFEETAKHTASDINEPNNIQKSYQIREELHNYIPNTIILDETEVMGKLIDLGLFRKMTYYDTILRSCKHINEYGKGIPNETIIFIKKNMPDLYQNIEEKFPELIQ